MRRLSLSLVLTGLLSCLAMTTAAADEQAWARGGGARSSVSSAPDDPSNLIRSTIPERRLERSSLIPASPLGGLHDASDRFKKSVYDSSYINLGLAFNHLFQSLSDAVPGEDDWGTTTDMDLIASWEVLNRGKPNHGELFFHLEGRGDYGTTGPQDLGFVSAATAGGTANSFSRYTPHFIIRNLYWEHGGPEAGWGYRIGKITPDSILATSKHISPNATFLANVGTGLFSSGYPDSGLGVAGIWHFNDRFKVLGLLSDANADRFDFGDITEGDFYKAVEFGAKLFPRTEKAGYSKLTLWHTDGTKGQPSNANTGRSGWGMTVKAEQELTADGNLVGLVRWGKSWDETSIFEQQLGLHFLYYNPGGLKHDVIGAALNWTDSVAAGTRDEYNLEIFYRFPLFPGVDTRVSYQSVFDPAFTREFDHVSVFSFGLRTVF